MSRGLDRGLPARTIDLIRDGVSAADLRARGHVAVWSALVSTSASASQRGWDCWEWQELVKAPSSALGRQVATRDGVKPRTAESVRKMLDGAWDKGTEWASEQPAPWGRAQAVAEAGHRADLLSELAADPDAPVVLTPAMRAVLAHAADSARKLSSVTPALPRQQMLAATGLGLTALRTALRDLDRLDLLTLHERGRRQRDGGRANLYRMPAEDHPAVASYLYRETRSVVPPAQVCSAPLSEADGAPAEVCSAPPSTATSGDPAMVTLTVSASNADQLAEVLALIRGTDVTITRSTPVEQDVERESVPGRRLHAVRSAS